MDRKLTAIFFAAGTTDEAIFFMLNFIWDRRNPTALYDPKTDEVCILIESALKPEKIKEILGLRGDAVCRVPGGSGAENEKAIATKIFTAVHGLESYFLYRDIADNGQ